MVSAASTQAEIKLLGSGNLVEYLDKLNKSNSQFLKDAKSQQKTFENLNKTSKKTEETFKGLAESSKGFLEGLTKLNRSGRSTIGFFKDTGSATISLQENLEKSTKGFKGLALASVGFRDEAKSLNKVLEGPASQLSEIADAGSNTERAFILLDKASKPLSAGLNRAGNAARSVGQGFQQAEVYMTNFSRGVVNVGAKSLNFFSNSFQEVANNLRTGGIFGKMFASNFDAVAKALDTSAEKAADFSKQISPEQFQAVDKAGGRLAKVFEGVGSGLDKMSKGVIIADFVGDISRATMKAQDFASTLKEDASYAVEDFGNTARFAIPLLSAMVTKMQMLGFASTALGMVLKNDLFKALGSLLGRFSDLGVGVAAFQQLTLAAGEAVLKAKGVSDAFTVMQNLGIDTSAASMAFQFGLVGEKLLLSSEAAKAFGQAAVTAFAQLEDAAAFVTTLTSGAEIQLEGFDQGIDSISASLTDLVNGPLKNAVTSTQAASALYNALSAGVGITTVAGESTLQLAETNQFLESSLKLSAATGADAAQTLELLAKTSKAYSLSNSKAAETAAKLYQIVEQGIVTFPQLTNGLSRTMSAARSVGVSFDEAAASIAALTKVGDADQVMMGFESLMRSIIGQGAEAQKTISELGIRFDANTVKTKGLAEALKDLYVATGGNASTLRQIIPDSLAFTTAMQLMTTVNQDVAGTMTAVQGAGEDLLDDVFEKRNQSTIQQFSMLMNGFNEVMVDFGRRAIPTLEPAIGFLEGLLNILQNMPEPMKQAIGVIVLVQTGLSNVGGAAIGFIASLLKVGVMIAGFNLAMKLMQGKLVETFKLLGLVNSQGFDWGKTLLILLGYTKGLTSENILMNMSLEKQADIRKKMQGLGLNFEGDISKTKDLKEAIIDVNNRVLSLQTLALKSSEQDLLDYRKDINNLENLKEALEIARNKLNDFKNGVGDAEGLEDSVIQDNIKQLERLEKKLAQFATSDKSFDVQIKELQQLGKELKKLQNIENDRAGGAIGRFATNIKLGIKAAAEGFSTGSAFVQQELRKFFGDIEDTIHVFTPEVKQSLMEIVDKEGLDLDQKIRILNDQFDLILADTPEHLKPQVEMVKATLLAGLKQIDTDSDTYLSKLKSSFIHKFANIISSDVAGTVTQKMDLISDTLKSGFNKMVDAGQATKDEFKYVFDNILSDPEITIQDKVRAINEEFSRIAEGKPEAVKANLERLKDVAVSGLQNIQQEAQVQAEKIKTSFSNFVSSEAGVDMKAKMDAFAGFMAASFEQVPEKIKAQMDELNTVLTSSLENTAAGVKERTDRVKAIFDSMLEDASPELKDSLLKIKETIITDLENISTSVKSSADVISQSFRDFIDSDFVKTKLDEVKSVFETGLGYIPEEVLVATQEIKTHLESGLDEASITVKDKINFINEKFDSLIRDASPEVVANLQKIKVTLTNELANLSSVALIVTEQVNNSLKEVADDQVQNVVKQNVGQVDSVLKQGGEKIVNTVKQTTDQVEARMRKVGKAGNSIGNLISNFVPGFAMFQSIAQDAGDVLTDLGFGMDKFGQLLKGTNKTQAVSTALTVVDNTTKKKVVATNTVQAATTMATAKANNIYSLSALKSAASSKLMAANSAIATKAMAMKNAVMGGGAKIMPLLAGGLKALIPLIAGAAAGFGSILVMLGPIVAIVAGVTVALIALAKILGALIPGFNRLISANARASYRLEKFRKELYLSNDELYKLNTRLGELDGKEIDIAINIKSKKELKEERERILGALVPDEKEFSQGLRGLTINIMEGLTAAASSISDFLGGGNRNLAAERAANFAKEADDFGTAYYEAYNFELDRLNKEQDSKRREAFNRWRKNWQDWIEKDIILQLAAISEANEALLTTNDDAITKYQEGQAATIEGQAILQKALSENRALTGDEMLDLQKVETEYFQKLKQMNSERIAGLQAEMEELKNPARKQQLQDEIDKLSERNALLEEANQKVIRYRENIQALLTTMESNDAAKGVDNLNASIQDLYDNLDPQAQTDFRETLNLEVDATPVIEMMEDTGAEVAEAQDGMFKQMGMSTTQVAGFKNNVTANFEEMGLAYETGADRMRTRAVAASQASLSAVVAAINDPEKEVTYDDLQTNIFGALDAIGEGYVEEGDKVAAMISTLNKEIVVDGRNALLKDLIKPQDQEQLATTLTETIQAGADRVVNVNEQKIAEITAQEQSGLKTAEEALKERNALEEENTRTIIDSKKAQLDALEQAGMGSYRVAEDLAREITRLEIEESAKRLQNRKEEIEAKDRVALESNNAAIAQTQALVAGRRMTEVEGLKEVARLEEENNNMLLQNKKDYLAEVEKEFGRHSEEYRRVENEMLTMTFQNDAARLENKRKILEAELNLLQQQKDNEFNLIKQGFEKEQGLRALREKAIQLEQQAMASNRELANTILAAEESAMRTKLKFTGDIVEKARIELQLAQSRQAALEQEHAFELQNLELQQTLQKLNLEREKSALAINKLELERQLILAQTRLAKSEELKLIEEERTALELQISSLNQQIDLNGQQQTQLENQSKVQDQINAQQKEGMRIRQDAARQTSAADVELAKLEKINAEYEKQKQVLQNQTRLVELQGEERIANLEQQSNIMNKQTEILQKQLEIVKQSADVSQRMYSLAQQGALSGFRQRRIEKEAAEARRRNLEKTQEIERANLQLNQLMRDLALERRKIELDVAEAKQRQALLEAQIEARKLANDPRATAEQREAANLNVYAQQQGLVGINRQRELIAFEEGMNELFNNLEIQQQRRDQRAQVLEADMAVANLSRGRSARRAVGQEALSEARDMQQTFTQEVSQLSENFNQLNTTLTRERDPNASLDINPLALGQSTLGVINQGNILNAITSPQESHNTANTQIEGTVNVVLEVKGEGANNLNREELQRSASDSLYEGLNKLFDYHINRNR